MNKKEIYLAGGCFWGVEKYLASIKGVTETQVGYANGYTQRPSYEDVCYHNSGHAEIVKVVYDADILSLDKLLSVFYRAIDPTSLNAQGPDRGSQYRSGIYYSDAADLPVISESLAALQQQYQAPLVIEALPLANYYPAEAYHQKYLEKNPTGYCHISAAKFAQAAGASIDNPSSFQRKTDAQLRQELSRLQYQVTQENATEPPFTNEYNNQFGAGIYVDITTGEPLFSSKDKFSCSCGWPAFAKPISDELVTEVEDRSHGMYRVEVRSKLGNAHLGHVFNDGPKDRTGLRYCINSASLRFVPAEDMAEAGYAEYLPLV